MKKVIVSILIAAVLIGGLSFWACRGKTDSSGEVIGGLGYFTERDEVINRINAYAAVMGYKEPKWYDKLFANKKSAPVAVDDAATSPPPTSAALGAEAGEGSGNSFTRTNTQVEGIDEGDIIKADGGNIYILSQTGFYIVKADNGKARKLSEIRLQNYVPIEMYIEGNKLILIGGVYTPFNVFYYSYAEGRMWYPSTQKTDIRIYDITDKTSPKLDRQITVDGSYNTGRLIDGAFYYMIQYSFNFGREETYIPKISDSAVNNGAEKEIAPEDINFFDDIPHFGYLIVGKISLSDASGGLKAYLGAGGTVYVSPNNIYTACPEYYGTVDDAHSEENNKPHTRIIRINIKDFYYNGRGRVEGKIKDKYSLDEYEGYLRIATSTSYYSYKESRSKQYSSVFVLDGELKIASTITDIAPGESIYSVRFNGAEGSLVTFRQVDPLYKLDFTDPLNPKISEGLKKDGVSMYLHYIEGTNYLIGLGQDSRTNEWGGVTWGGIEVTLFDVSGEEAEVNNSVYIGNYGSYAEALYNPKAILYDKDKNIFAFAAEAWIFDENNYYQRLQAQGYYVFGIEGGRLAQRAFLTDIEKEPSYNGWQEYQDYTFGCVKRAARIGDYLYTVSDRYVTAYTLEDFRKTDKITLADITIDRSGNITYILK